MIVILCDSFQDAEDSYYLFLDYVRLTCPPWSVVRAFDKALIIDTDDDIRYVFIDYRYCNYLFKDKIFDLVEKEVFFEDLYTDETAREYFHF